jgi:hypothetical protein
MLHFRVKVRSGEHLLFENWRPRLNKFDWRLHDLLVNVLTLVNDVRLVVGPVDDGLHLLDDVWFDCNNKIRTTVKQYTIQKKKKRQMWYILVSCTIASFTIVVI